MIETESSKVRTTTERDTYGSLVAVALQQAEVNLDAYLATLGEALTLATNGRVQNQMGADVLQPALERFGRAMTSAIESRQHIVSTHSAAAIAGRRHGIDWTTVAGPTESTPQDPEIDGIKKGG